MNGEIYGAQIVGQEGADKRIDTIASVMRMKGSVSDLEELELAYAPPYSSAKDPVNMLGFTAENVLNHYVSFMSCDELDRLSASEAEGDRPLVLDVTEEVERMVYPYTGFVPHSAGAASETPGRAGPGEADCRILRHWSQIV